MPLVHRIYTETPATGIAPKSGERVGRPRVQVGRPRFPPITDMLWTRSRRVRAWRGGDVRAVYYEVLNIVALWGIIALARSTPCAVADRCEHRGRGIRRLVTASPVRQHDAAPARGPPARMAARRDGSDGAVLRVFRRPFSPKPRLAAAARIIWSGRCASAPRTRVENHSRFMLDSPMEIPRTQRDSPSFADPESS